MAYSTDQFNYDPAHWILSASASDLKINKVIAPESIEIKSVKTGRTAIFAFCGSRRNPNGSVRQWLYTCTDKELALIRVEIIINA